MFESISKTAFTPPYTLNGISSLVRRPPWHYAGWVINVAFSYDMELANAWVPKELGTATGEGCVHFADWQACTDGHELEDPVYSQYKETIVVLQIKKLTASLLAFVREFGWIKIFL